MGLLGIRQEQRMCLQSRPQELLKKLNVRLQDFRSCHPKITITHIFALDAQLILNHVRPNRTKVGVIIGKDFASRSIEKKDRIKPMKTLNSEYVGLHQFHK